MYRCMDRYLIERESIEIYRESVEGDVALCCICNCIYIYTHEKQYVAPRLTTTTFYETRNPWLHATWHTQSGDYTSTGLQ